MLKKVLAIVGFSALALAQGFPDADKVNELWQQPNLTFGMYSGYVLLPNTTKELHYVAVLSQNNATTDPVILWLNGGPGCSSLLGYTMEHGPYVIEDGQQNFTANPYAWNKNATVIYLDSPAGIGFSLCGNLSECRFNDSYSGNDNVAAALQLLTVKFPALKDNDLWLSGQGYSGIFVPWLARGLDQWINQTRTLDPLAWVPKLKGILVGNGFTDFKYDGLPAFVTMAHYHGLIDDELFDALGQCNLTYVNVKGYGNFSEQCINSIQTFNYYTSFANNFDIYGYCFKGWEMPSQLPGHESLALRSLQQVPGNFIPCLWTKPMVDYYNNQTVKTQLNIKPEMLTSNWTACTYPGINNFSYTYNISGSVWIYNELRGKGYRLLAYSGDTDSLIPTLGTQQWINAQGWNVTEAWRPYYIPVTADTKKVAGYVEVRGDFTLATVHGGGHQAAKNRRQQTYQAVFNFINNVPL